MGAFLWTLFWIIRAIAPRSGVPYPGLNRFAWPSLVTATADQLASHAAQSSVEDDAWQQVTDLAKIAKRKFDACGLAIYGFGVVICAGFFTVVAAGMVEPQQALNSTDNCQQPAIAMPSRMHSDGPSASA